MPKTPLLRSLLTAAGLGLLGLTGCGGQRSITVAGKVILPPHVKLAQNDVGTVKFLPVDPSGKSAGGQISASDLSFAIKDLAPGKYKIAVHLTPYAGSEGSAKRARLYAHTNQTFDGRSAKLTCEVAQDSRQAIIIDLAHGSLTKQ